MASRLRVPSVCVAATSGRDLVSRTRPATWMLSEWLRAAGLPVRVEGAQLDLLAAVLGEIHGDPMRLTDGEPLRL